MKILVLYHTFWAAMMADTWSRVPGVEVKTLPLPVADWTPEQERQMAEAIVGLVEVDRPDFVVDVNGTGMIPLDGEFSEWTANSIDRPWVEWWWDDPCGYIERRRACGQFAGWAGCIESTNVTHCFWDRTLAREFSRWLPQRKCHYLPTATHAQAFSPDSAAQSTEVFEPVDVCFLGTRYADACSDNSEFRAIAEERMAHPEKDYFAIGRARRDELPGLNETLNRCRGERLGWADDEMLKYRFGSNALVGEARRSVPLHKLMAMAVSKSVAGDGWADGSDGLGKKLYNPSHISARYRSATCCLELGNGQSFAGTTIRAYEIMSCGGTLVTLEPPGFDPEGTKAGELYLIPESMDELPELIAECKSDSARISKLREAARDYVARKHDWLHRLGSLVEILSGN